MPAAFALLAQVAVQPPPVELNHFYITVDRPTWKAIQSSRWLKRSFARVDSESYSTGSESWTGIYVNGIGSYVEIFAAGPDFKEGQAGIAFITPAGGGADTIAFGFRKGHFGNRTERELMNLAWKGKPQPFSHIVSYKGQDPKVNVWVMEYHEDFLRRCGVSVGATQAQLNAERSRRSKRPNEGLMRDLTGITVTRGRPDLDRALELMGFQRSDGGHAWRLGRSEVRFASPAAYGITEARFSLRKRPAKIHIERFGPNCWLRVEPNGTAVWKFR